MEPKLKTLNLKDSKRSHEFISDIEILSSSEKPCEGDMVLNFETEDFYATVSPSNKRLFNELVAHDKSELDFRSSFQLGESPMNLASQTQKSSKEAYSEEESKVAILHVEQKEDPDSGPSSIELTESDEPVLPEIVLPKSNSQDESSFVLTESMTKNLQNFQHSESPKTPPKTSLNFKKQKVPTSIVKSEPTKTPLKKPLPVGSGRQQLILTELVEHTSLDLEDFPYKENYQSLFEQIQNYREFNYDHDDVIKTSRTLKFTGWNSAQGLHYKGQVTYSGKRWGKGVEIGPDYIYEGYWRKNKRYGLGRVISSKGECYQGFWFRDQKSGFGVFKYGEEMYIGDWDQDTYNGKGTEVTFDGTYEGDFRNGKRHGKGKLCTEDGKVYSGKFSRGVPHGYGVVSYTSGEFYAGIFVEGEKKGSKNHVIQGLSQSLKLRTFREESVEEPIQKSPEEPIRESPEEPIRESLEEPIQESPEEPIQESPEEPPKTTQKKPKKNLRVKFDSNCLEEIPLEEAIKRKEKYKASKEHFKPNYKIKP